MYKSLPIGEDSYLLECGRYIERNPLRAGLVKAAVNGSIPAIIFMPKEKKINSYYLPLLIEARLIPI
jgi:hypothetical protein